MLLPSRKPAILLNYYHHLCPSNSHHRPTFACTTSCPTARRPYAHHAIEHDAEEGAHHHAHHGHHAHHQQQPDLSWPDDAVHPHRAPTPYQILSCTPGQPYSKHRFYHLVKLYHPDRPDPSSPAHHLPPHVRLERYRLLVAAHAILSDDAKRRAYDAWGLGWAGNHHHPVRHDPHHPWGAEHRQWTHDPAHNATWEDWERWHQRETGEEPAPRDIHISNFAFVSLVFAIVTLGGVMQGTRASVFGSSVMEQRDRIHKEASIELARSKRATLSGDRNERIRTFLEHREATIAGEDAYQRLLPPSDTCAPDTARKH